MRGFGSISLRTGDSLGSEVVKSILDRSTSVNIPHRSNETGSTVRGDLITLPFNGADLYPFTRDEGGIDHSLRTSYQLLADSLTNTAEVLRSRTTDLGDGPTDILKHPGVLSRFNNVRHKTIVIYKVLHKRGYYCTPLVYSAVKVRSGLNVPLTNFGVGATKSKLSDPPVLLL